ncbi:hypothetical protein OS493_006043 [Desmophyllum pertusum]|uniref:ADAM10 cysteine-rich domain-containing protein n=1 Tax=Desmophyllum pertusum TaxID=174260 RepID=A0A9X0CG25_9CNID|nr:hypothetical protein OS493_006043 [Desmophyllum pertusum]
MCALYGTNECECHQNSDELCHVCCNTSRGVCTSAQHFVGRVILKSPGSTCKLHRGYCDSFGVCITVDSDDELDKLKDAFKRFFSKAAMSDLWSWIKEQWYYVLVIFGGICLLVVLLKVNSGGRTSLLSLARRAIGQRNQHAGSVRTHQLSVEFNDAAGSSGIGNRNLGEADESPEYRLQLLFPDATSLDLLRAIRHSTSEQAAINRLLAQGYEMNEC